MKKKLSKVLAVVLSLVMVAGLATIDASTAQAAKKKKATKLSIVSTGKKNVKSGQKRTIKIKGTNAKKAKWSVSGTGKSYVKLSKKTGKKVTITVSENATGKAKVTAKLTKKNKVSYTYNLSCDATAIALEGKDIYTGETAKLALSATPSNAKVSADVAYGVFSDETAVTATTDAVVTGAGIEGCEFYTAKAGTYYVKATAGEMTSIAKVTATERVAKLESVVQTKKDELVATFDSDASKVVGSDIEIKNGIGVVMTVKNVEVDKDDKTKAKITTFSTMLDGKENSVSYKGGEEIKFMASNGEVATIEITPDVAPINTAVDVKANVLDVNKVVLNEFKYGSQPDNYTFEINAGDAGSADPTTGKLTMETIGKTAEVTVVYKTGKQLANGDPDDRTFKQVITATAEGKISSATEYKFFKFDSAPDSDKSYSDMMKDNGGDAKDKVRVQPSANSTAYYLYAIVKDDNGYERINGVLNSKYTLKSSNDDVLLVDSELNEIKGASKGKAYILVYDKDELVFSIPVEVEEMSKLAKLDISTADATMKLSTAPRKEVSGSGIFDNDEDEDRCTFTVKAYDQYNEPYGDVTAEVKANGKNAYVNADATPGKEVKVNVKVNTVATAGSAEIPTSAATKKPDGSKGVEGEDYIVAGHTVNIEYTLTVKDSQNADNKELTKSLYVKLSRPYDNGKSVSLEVRDAGANIDTALVNKNNNAEKVATIRLAVLDKNGTFVRYDWLPSMGGIGGMEFLKGTSKIDNNMIASGTATDVGDGVDRSDPNCVVTAGAFKGVTADNATNNGHMQKIQFIATEKEDVSVTASGGSFADGTGFTGKVIKRADSAKYTVRIKNIQVSNQKVEYGKGNPCTSVIEVKNTQKPVTAVLNVRNGLEGEAAHVAARAFKINAGDTDSYTYVEGENNHARYGFGYPKNGAVYLSNSNSLKYTKLTIYVPYKDANGDIDTIHGTYDRVTINATGVVTPE